MHFMKDEGRIAENTIKNFKIYQCNENNTEFEYNTPSNIETIIKLFSNYNNILLKYLNGLGTNDQWILNPALHFVCIFNLKGSGWGFKFDLSNFYTLFNLDKNKSYTFTFIFIAGTIDLTFQNKDSKDLLNSHFIFLQCSFNNLNLNQIGQISHGFHCFFYKCLWNVKSICNIEITASEKRVLFVNNHIEDGEQHRDQVNVNINDNDDDENRPTTVFFLSDNDDSKHRISISNFIFNIKGHVLLDIRSVKNNVIIINNLDYFGKNGFDCRCTNSQNITLHLSNSKIACIGLQNTELKKLVFKNVEFENIPDIDHTSKITSSTDIDKSSFDNLLKIDKNKAGPLDFSRLAEFFNRSNAYIEAQQLHRHYLKSKKNESSSKGFKFLVFLYNLVNGCGSTIKRPVSLLLVLFILVLIIDTLFYKTEVLMIDRSSLEIYSYYDFHFLKALQQAILTIITPLSFIHTPNYSTLPILLQIFMYFVSLISTLLFFLIALQIRKLLRLKD
ncbi:hypothetical protein L3V83_13865 [Thiotrichales bacterium 19X7-9]|nr:hypothetical protein [Thiotrichales bacterium 19X7-9]